MKRLLVQLYGWKDGFKLNELTDDLLQRKIDLCENYLSVYSKVEPSLYTKWRGRILEEMIGPTVMLSKRKFEANQESFCVCGKNVVANGPGNVSNWSSGKLGTYS